MKIIVAGFVLANLFFLGNCSSDQPPTLPIPTKSNDPVVDELGAQSIEFVPEETSEIDLIYQDIRKMIEAVYQADVQTTLLFTHPKVIKLMGGQEQAAVYLEKVYGKFDKAGLKLKSQTFPSEPIFLSTNERRYVIVPTLIVVEINGQTLESLNYQFGVLEKGASNWKYLEGSRVNNQTVNQFFSDFPSDYKFPQIYRKKISNIEH